MADLIARLRERAEFEDRRVLDEAKALGFVPEVYSGSQTGALLLEAAAALEAARKEAARWRFVAQFMQLDDVGDDQYCLGLIVNYEALEDMVTAQSTRLDGERRRLEWADVQGPEDSPKTLPPITLDAAIDATIDQARGKGVAGG